MRIHAENIRNESQTTHKPTTKRRNADGMARDNGIIDWRVFLRYNVESVGATPPPVWHPTSPAAEGSTMIRLSSLLALSLASAAMAGSPDPKSLEIPADELSRARELVQQLGSDQYATREKAEQELAKMGRLARPVLLEAANTDPNQEVRARCSSLLPKATALDLKARIDVFLADADGKYEHDLPGWHQFRGVLREEWSLFGFDVWSDHSLDKPARAVFAEMIAAPDNRQIMMAVGGPKSELSSIASARRQELYAQKFPRAMVRGGRVIGASTTLGRDVTVDDIATLLFVESLVPSKFAPRATSIERLITASGFTNAARETDDKGRVLLALASAWIDSRSDPIDLYQTMTIATNLGLKEQGCRVAARLLSTAGVVGTYRGMAASNLASNGNKDHIPLLDKALADTAVAYTIRENAVAKALNERPTHDVQVRDMALAAAISVSRQKLEDYGFVDNFASAGGMSSTSYTYSRHYIPAEKREAMHKKWKDWRAKNP